MVSSATHSSLQQQQQQHYQQQHHHQQKQQRQQQRQQQQQRSHRQHSSVDGGAARLGVSCQRRRLLAAGPAEGTAAVQQDGRPDRRCCVAGCRQRGQASRTVPASHESKKLADVHVAKSRLSIRQTHPELTFLANRLSFGVAASVESAHTCAHWACAAPCRTHSHLPKHGILLLPLSASPSEKTTLLLALNPLPKVRRAADAAAASPARARATLSRRTLAHWLRCSARAAARPT